ncbi:hypothetical protein Q8A67_018241 [Cirrhinus molitorella]|uniref:Uncharacterized protein n=1 Tax=Cirrhinus molitorella TaxID=172907 RepID=A0AA88PE17_9TELE|nr:hypothetical protein Q8A67_018241 [Cirrhinus molitorella]
MKVLLSNRGEDTAIQCTQEPPSELWSQKFFFSWRQSDGLVPERQEERAFQRRRIGRSAPPATQLCLFLSELSGQGSCLFTQPCQLSTFSRALERHPAGGGLCRPQPALDPEGPQAFGEALDPSAAPCFKGWINPAEPQ